VVNEAGDSAATPSFYRAALASTVAIVAVLATALTARAEGSNDPYPRMAPFGQYLMDRSEEIALARSAAPRSISQDAEVLVLTREGYDSVAPGTNGFVCMVQRSWAAGPDDPEFWNPRLRAPICFNPPAARSYLPQITRKTDWALAGRTKAQIAEDLGSALAMKVLPTPEVGSMCYMMSKEGYLNDRDGHWYPHLMFFLPLAEPSSWGAGLPGSPVLGSQDRLGGVTVFLVPVGQWSDGTAAPRYAH